MNQYLSLLAQLQDLSFNTALVLGLGVYAVSTALMLAMVPHLLATWNRSYMKRRLPSAFLRLHPSCPMLHHGWTTLRPDNSDKMGLLVHAAFPLWNTAVLLLLAIALPIVWLRTLAIKMVFGSEKRYQGWLRAY